MAVDKPDGATLLDPDEKDGLRFKHITVRGELDQLEQANIVEGLQWLKKQKNADILSECFVRELHKRLFGQVWRWAGTFRQTEKNIGVDPVQIAVQLRLLLDDARYWIAHETYPSMELAVRFHHRLVLLHLFPNGNGRHARIIADAILTKILDKPAIDWTGGYKPEAMNERRGHYIAALRAADKHDFSKLLAFVGL
ncbi:MAG: mobile mystery protein B [Gammaproteobacteria bacterium]|nr:mobile mystery protein B [Gammaproteobacteria bacterium]